MRNKDQLKYDIDLLRYSADMSELRRRMCRIMKNLADGMQAEIDIDSETSETSENALQNKVVTAELNRLQQEIDSIETPTMRDFVIESDTGCLMLTEVGRDDGTGFEIDEDGNFNVVID